MTTEEILQQCTVIGNNVKLPNVTLDYKLEYIPLKKKLEGIGGQWKGGKIEAFVFDSDPTELLTSLQDGNQINLKKDFQFFATPENLGMHLIGLSPISLTQPRIKILEPSAGDGALIKCIHAIAPDVEVDCFELMPVNIKKLNALPNVFFMGEDFLQAVELDGQFSDKILFKERYDLIIANPPFTKNQDIDHIYAMYKCLKPGGALVSIVSKSWTFGEQKKQVTFKNWLKSIGAYLEEVDAGKFKESGTMVGSMIISLRKDLAHEDLFPSTPDATHDVRQETTSDLFTEEKIPEAIIYDYHRDPNEILQDIEESVVESIEALKNLKTILNPKSIEMSFFKQISEILGDAEISLTVKAKNDKITVMVLPRNKSIINPLVVTGTHEELDEGFFELINGPISQSSGLTSNVEEFVQQIAAPADQGTAPSPKRKSKTKVKPESEAETNAVGSNEVISETDTDLEAERLLKEQKEAEDEATAKKLEEKKKAEAAEVERISKYDHHIEIANGFVSSGEYKKAAISLKLAKEFSLTPDELDGKIQELMKKHFEAEMADLV
jgi:PRTRC genetic system protein E